MVEKLTDFSGSPSITLHRKNSGIDMRFTHDIIYLETQINQ